MPLIHKVIIGDSGKLQPLTSRWGHSVRWSDFPRPEASPRHRREAVQQRQEERER